MWASVWRRKNEEPLPLIFLPLFLLDDEKERDGNGWVGGERNAWCVVRISNNSMEKG